MRHKKRSEAESGQFAEIPLDVPDIDLLQYKGPYIYKRRFG